MFIFINYGYIITGGTNGAKEKTNTSSSFNQTLISDYYFNAIDQLTETCTKDNEHQLKSL